MRTQGDSHIGLSLFAAKRLHQQVISGFGYSQSSCTLSLIQGHPMQPSIQVLTMTRSRETQSETIILELPPDLAQLLQQQSQQSGQSPAAVILAILRLALGQSAMASELEQSDTRSQKAILPYSPELQIRPETPATQAGSSIASLWMQVNQENQPPASVPSTLMPPEACPKCGQRLSPPFQSTGRQVCGHCGWTNKPCPEAQIDDKDLRSLLAQAVSESLENMKPRKKRN